jgi:hypothetical protein
VKKLLLQKYSAPFNWYMGELSDKINEKLLFYKQSNIACISTDLADKYSSYGQTDKHCGLA